MSTGFARLASPRQKLAELRPRLFRERRQLEAGCGAGVGAKDSEAARVRQHRDPAAPRERLAREQHGDVDQLLERVGLNHSGLPEQRLDRGRRPRKRRGVRARRALARRRAPALHRQDRLLAGDAAGRPARTCAGCRTTPGRARRAPSPASSSQYSSRSFDETSALLPIETKRESPSPRAVACSSRARPSAPLCDEKPMFPAGNECGAKVAFNPARPRRCPRQFGPTSRAPCARTSDSSSSWRRSPSDAGLGEPRRDHAERARTLAERSLRLGQHSLTRHAEDGEVDVAGDVRDRRVGLNAGDRRRLRVHRIGDAVEAGLEDVAEELAADRATTGRGADDRHRARREERPQRRGDGDVIALVDGSAITRGGLDLEAHLRRAALEPPRDGEAGVGEDAEHRLVVRHDFGDERRDPGRGGRLGQLLQQARADTVTLKLVGDGEGDLGAARVAQPRKAREATTRSSSVPINDPRVIPVGIDEGLDRLGGQRSESRGTAGKGFRPRDGRRTRAALSSPLRPARATAACSRRAGSRHGHLGSLLPYGAVWGRRRRGCIRPVSEHVAGNH